MYLICCNFVKDPTKEQHQILCRSRKKCDIDVGSDWTSIWGRKHEPYMGVLTACSSFLLYQWDCSQTIHYGRPNS
jgi:hypothetical protein